MKVIILILILTTKVFADITGAYYVDPYHTPSARYYITERTNGDIFWFGDSNIGGWKNYAEGKFDPSTSTYTVNWFDPPPGTNSGSVNLQALPDGSLVVTGGSGFEANAVFKKVDLGDACRGISGEFYVFPYHTESARYFITQESETKVRWFGNSYVTDGWRNIGTGTISGNDLTVEWVDIFPSPNNGIANFRINPDGSLLFKGGSGFELGSVFVQVNSVLSGTYAVAPYHTPSARYYISINKNTVTWLGDSKTGAWRNIGTGTINQDGTVDVDWVDPPPGSNSGSVTLKINPDTTLTVTNGEGFDIGAVFTYEPVIADIGITGVHFVEPYHTPSARYYITQTSEDSIVWLGLSNNGGWRNTGVGSIIHSKNILQVQWTDIPPSVNSGEATFFINPDKSLTFIAGTGFDFKSVFSFDAPGWVYTNPLLNGVYKVEPYHTASARYHISQTSPSEIVWYGDSNNGAWRNTATGRIEGNYIYVNWNDPPPGTNQGAVTLKVNRDGTLQVESGAGFDVGSVFSKVPVSVNLGITGVYTVAPYHTSTAKYYISQISNTEIVWYGDSNNGGWRNTAKGTISGSKISVDWVDILPSTNKGSTVLNINADGTLTVASGTGFDIGSVFAKFDQVISGKYSVHPYHTPEAEYYITRLDEDRIAWYGNSNNGGWRNTAKGVVSNGRVFVKWEDIAPSVNANSVTLAINPDRTLSVIGGEGFVFAAQFKLSPLPSSVLNSVTGPYYVSPYHTSSARYYITQTSENTLVWLGLSNNGGWSNTATGTLNNGLWTVDWIDFPNPNGATNSGTSTLKLNDDRTLSVVGGTGFDVDAKFTFSAPGFSTVSNPVAFVEMVTATELSVAESETAFNPLIAVGVVSGVAAVGVVAGIVYKVKTHKSESSEDKYQLSSSLM